MVFIDAMDDTPKGGVKVLHSDEYNYSCGATLVVAWCAVSLVFCIGICLDVVYII